MFKNLICKILVLLTLSSCGYVVIHKTSENMDYKITITQLEGDIDINNIYKMLSINSSSKDSKKEILVNVSTNYSKNIVGKNIKGSASDYRLLVESKFTATINEKNLEILLSEYFIIKKSDKNFEQLNYEKSIKKNLANLIYQNFIRELSF